MAAKSARRRFTVFSLSFLDVMSCGFGAVVLIFLIINHRIETDTTHADRELLSESRKLDFLIATGRKDLVDLREQVEDRRKRVADAQRRLESRVADRDRKRDEQDELEKRTLAETLSIEELKSDVDSREAEVKLLQAEEEAVQGTKVREIKGEGDRQYLTGLFVGGTHILIALDISASMLDRTIVQIVRRRNMVPERQRNAPKWVRAVRTVEWLAAQIPLDSNFQIAVFADQTRFLLPSSTWHEVLDPTALSEALTELEGLLPAGGTSLSNLANAIAGMAPLPDNVFVITDGLPTLGDRAPRRATITGRQRIRLFEDAVKLLPRQIPINPILLPLEGDPLASSAYWQLAVRTGGTYMSPSEDWP